MIITISYKDELPAGFVEVNCTSRGTDEWKNLSPFMSRPITTVDGLVASNLENMWQFSKVYPQHVDEHDNIRDEFYEWRANGFKDTYAHRYPMGKGAKPLFLLWGDERLDYVAARKKVYFPKYEESVKDTEIFKKLQDLYNSGVNIAIRDFDVYRIDQSQLSINDILNNTDRKAGHGFVLYKMLTDKKQYTLF